MPRLGKEPATSRRAAAIAAVRQAWLTTFSATTVGESGQRRMRWADLCRMPEFVGRWVALDDVEFDDGHPIDGEVIDADIDLATLCGRVQSDDGTNCTIVFCDASGTGSRRAGTG
jgi:hypothetical protein